jgi:hypothetical protein
VTMTATRGRDLGVGFRYGRNLTRIKREVEPPYATRLFPYGAQDLNVAGINGGAPYIEDYSWYTGQGLTLEQAEARFLKTRVWSDPTFVVDVELLAAAEVKLASWAQPTVRYECDVVDLSEIVGVQEILSVGDTVRVADQPLGLDVSTTVVRRRRYPLEPWRDRVELAYLPSTISDSSDTSRTQASVEWLMFKSDNGADYEMRNDGSYLTNRIGLSFRAEGEAVFGFDVNGVGVGAGTLTVTLYDAETDEDLHPPLVIAYTDGAAFHDNATWAMKDLEGQYDIRVRMVADSSGAASPTNGIDLTVGESRLWVLAHGAVQQTPTVENSEVFEYTGAVQTFTVPDNVTEVTVEAVAASGGGGGRGRGGSAVASFPVVPGTIYDVYVGGDGDNSPVSGNIGGWPNGGGTQTGEGGGGGGASYVTPTGAGLASSLLVVGGGGGGSEAGISRPDPEGGDGGFFAGGDGTDAVGPDNTSQGGAGATQFAGGAGGVGPVNTGESGDTLGQGYGGRAVEIGGLNFDTGAGGGGWHGGGAGGWQSLIGGGFYSGDGGGGSGYVDAAGFDLTFTDGANLGDGVVTISWDSPLEGV